MLRRRDGRIKRPKTMKAKALALTRTRGLAVAAMAAAILALVAVSIAAHPGRHRDRQVIRIESQGAMLGITMQELTDELREGLDIKADGGVLVSSVIEGSAAEKAGIEEGDIIVEFDGKEVDSPEDLRKMIGDREVGDEVKVKLVRDGKSKTFDVALGDWEDHPDIALFNNGERFSIALPDFDDDVRGMIASLNTRPLGIRAHEMDDDLSDYFGVKEDEGVLVLDVVKESTAEGLGVKSGDVVVAIGDDKVKNIHDIREAMDDKETGDDINVTVLRKKKKVELKGKVAEDANVWVQRFPREWREHYGPRVRGYMNDMQRDLREEVDELRREVEELKKELDKS
jgi:S1-C subfamily serine protease